MVSVIDWLFRILKCIFFMSTLSYFVMEVLLIFEF